MFGSKWKKPDLDTEAADKQDHRDAILWNFLFCQQRLGPKTKWTTRVSSLLQKWGTVSHVSSYKKLSRSRHVLISSTEKPVQCIRPVVWGVGAKNHRLILFFLLESQRIPKAQNSLRERNVALIVSFW